MGVIRAQVTIPYHTALPADVATNTFHFKSDPIGGELTEATAEVITAQLSTFYQTIDNWLSGPTIDEANAEVSYYDLGDPEPRVPLFTQPLVFGPLDSTAALPQEVAATLSYRGPVVSGQVPARHRGRLYIGPLNTSAIAAGSSGRTVLAAPLVDALADAGTQLASLTYGFDPTWAWCVFSPTIYAATGELDAASTVITNGWVDNAPDTQRRRGTSATSRQLWPAP